MAYRGAAVLEKKIKKKKYFQCIPHVDFDSLLWHHHIARNRDFFKVKSISYQDCYTQVSSFFVNIFLNNRILVLLFLRREAQLSIWKQIEFFSCMYAKYMYLPSLIEI